MKLSVLGPLEVVDGASPVALGGGKERTVLAVLAVNAGEVVSESRLIEALWTDEPPRTATKTLQNYVLRLRKALRPADAANGALRIETCPPGYRLQAGPDALDSELVASLRSAARAAIENGDHRRAAALLDDALGRWRGPSLAEFAGQPFAIAEAARLDGLRQAMLEDRIEVALALGRHGDCVGELEALVAAHPLRERLWAQLMVALYRSGRQADALRAYQRARAALVEQLGIEPGAALRQLEQAVIDQDPSLDLVSASAPPRTGADAVLPPELVADDQPLFVGRRAELDRLSEAWRLACAGQRQAVLLGGEPGIGKTSLAKELAAVVHGEHGTVLFGRSDEDLGIPYQPFAEALRWYVAGCSDAALADRAGPLGGELAKLVPELASRLPQPLDPLRSEPELDRQRLFDAVAAILAAASGDAPVLLVLDDLHWATKPTLLLLRRVLRVNLTERLMVVGTYRDTELGPDHPLLNILAELHREPGVQRLAVAGLAEEEAITLVARRAGQDLGEEGTTFARLLYAETGGNPFFLGEVLHHLVETRAIYRQDGRWVSDRRAEDLDLPAGVREVVGRRLSHLSGPARRALSVASVVGLTFGLDLLERIPDAADGPDALLDALDEAVAAFVVVEVPGRPGSYSFGHALMRQVLLAGLTAARRARLHRRVGEAMETLPDTERRLGALARHFAEAGQVVKATDYAMRAGRDALEHLAFEQAVSYFEGGIRALDREAAPDRACRADLLLALAEARPLAGDRGGAISAAVRAAEDARAMGSAARLARAAMVHASLGVAGRPDAAVVPLCEEALAALGDEPSALRSQVMARLAMHRALWEGQRVGAGALAEEALNVARRVDDAGALHLALYVRAVTLVGSEHVDHRLGLAEELVALGEGSGEIGLRATGLRLRALARVEHGDLAGFDADLAEVERLAGVLRRRQFLSEAARWRTMQALLAGRFADAEAHSAEMLRHAGDDVNARSAHVCQLFFLRRDQGRLEEAVALPKAAAEQTPGLLTLQAMVALADAELGRVDEARRRLDSLATDGFGQVRRDFTWTASLSTLAALCDALGDTERAARVLELLRPHRGHLVVMGWGDVCSGAVDRYLGTLAATCGRWDEAEALFEAALALEAGMDAGPSLARTRTSFARMLAARGGTADHQRARELAAAAAAGAEDLGMAGVAAEAASLTASL